MKLSNVIQSMLIGLLAFLFLGFTHANANANESDSNTMVMYYHHDVRGDPVVVTDSSGSILWLESYRAYGVSEPRVSSEGIGFGDNSAAESNNRLGYTGHERDGSSGLTYMKARYYDNLTGRFLSNDPVGFKDYRPALFNRYMYVDNNPYIYIDPDGKDLVFADGTPPQIVDRINAELDEISNRSSTGKAVIDQLRGSIKIHVMKIGPTGRDGNRTTPLSEQFAYANPDGSSSGGSGSIIRYDPKDTSKGSPIVGFGHELGHSAMIDTGTHPSYEDLAMDANGLAIAPQTPSHETGLSMVIDNELRESYGLELREYYVE